MAHHPVSRPNPLDPLRSSPVPVSPGTNDHSGLDTGLSLSQLVSALSAHGGKELSADLALDLVLNQTVEQARLATDASAAAIALVRGREIICRATTGLNAPGLGERLHPHSGLSGQCIRTRKWQRCDDTQADTRVDGKTCRSLGVRSLLAFPVLRNQKVLGVIEIFSPRPNAFTDREIGILQALSEKIIENINQVNEVLAPVPVPVQEIPSIEVAQVLPERFVAESKSVSSDKAAVPEIEDLRSLSAVPEEPGAGRRDAWTTLLTAAVIGLALIVGWMVGRAGWQQATRRRHPEALRTLSPKKAATSSEVVQPRLLTPAPAASPNISPEKETSTRALSTATSSMRGTRSEVPADSLIVYDKGKVVFRTAPPQHSTQGENLDEGDNHNADATTPDSLAPDVADRYLTLRVEPEYPELAREQHIQGPVILDAIVGKSGEVRKLAIVSGDSRLAEAAKSAVGQWRFRPLIREGKPREFQTRITVIYRLP